MKFRLAIKTHFQCFPVKFKWEMETVKVSLSEICQSPPITRPESPRKRLFQGNNLLLFEQNSDCWGPTSGVIIMQSFRDEAQKNVEIRRTKKLSHPPPEKCKSHVQMLLCNHFMQKPTETDGKLVWKIFYFSAKIFCNPTIGPLLYGNSSVDEFHSQSSDTKTYFPF